VAVVVVVNLLMVTSTVADQVVAVVVTITNADQAQLVKATLAVMAYSHRIMKPVAAVERHKLAEMVQQTAARAETASLQALQDLQ
jgi:hypothetical protein